MIIDKLCESAKKIKKTIVLPEGEEERNIEAASIAAKEGIANIILLGNPKIINQKALELNVNIDSIKIIDINNFEHIDEFANELYELRKNKGVTLEDAYKLLKDPIYFGVMMAKLNYVDGVVSGAIHATKDLLKPAMQIIKTKEGTSLVSSFFIMETNKKELGSNGIFLFADCGVNPNPNEQELADIAIQTAKSAKELLNIEPKVALLSFSSKGSAEHELIDKVRHAYDIVKEKEPNLIIDGEIQVDAAIIPEVAQLKSPNSPLKGNANILIFPDLQAGNIGYKLVERLADATAIGPICQGFAKPVNDLS